MNDYFLINYDILIIFVVIIFLLHFYRYTSKIPSNR